MYFGDSSQNFYLICSVYSNLCNVILIIALFFEILIEQILGYLHGINSLYSVLEHYRHGDLGLFIRSVTDKGGVVGARVFGCAGFSRDLDLVFAEHPLSIASRTVF